MRLLGISCDGNGVEVAAGVLHADPALPGGTDFEAFVSLRREGPASVSDCALELVDEVLGNLVRSLAAGESGLPFELDGLVFNAGPGGFTAVRSACAMAQGLAMGWGKPLAALSSLEIWAEPLLQASSARQLMQQPQKALVLLDARMGELYCGLFDLRGDAPDTGEGGAVRLVSRAEGVMTPAALHVWLNENGASASGKRWLLGDFSTGWPELSVELIAGGWTSCLEQRLEGRSMLRAAFRAGSSAFRPAAEAGPHYVRNKVALNSQEQQQLRDQNAQGLRPPEPAGK